jgi:hypothetical protein
VRDLQNNQRYFFLGEIWFTLDKRHGFIGKDIVVSRYEELSSFSSMFSIEKDNRFADSHAWLGVVDRPSQSRFTRVQRVTCCVTLMYTFMCANMMWYGLLRAPSVTDHALGRVSVDWQDVVVGIISSIMVFPINIFVSIFFKKSEARFTAFDYGAKPGTAKTIEIDAMCDMSHTEDSVTSYDSQKNILPSVHRGSSTDSITNPVAGQLHRTVHAKKFQRQESRDVLDTSSSVSGATPHREEISKRIPGPKGHMWSYDGIMSWPEKIPNWKSNLDFRQSSAVSSLKQNGHPKIRRESSDSEDQVVASSKDTKRKNLMKRRSSRKISITESIQEKDEEFGSSADSGLPTGSSQDRNNIPMKNMRHESHRRKSSNATVSTLYSQRGRLDSSGTDVDSVFESRERTNSLPSDSEQSTVTTVIQTRTGSLTDEPVDSIKKTMKRFTPRQDPKIDEEVDILIEEIDSIRDDDKPIKKKNRKREESSSGQGAKSREEVQKTHITKEEGGPKSLTTEQNKEAR